MTITVAHQKPAVLDAVHTISIGGHYDPMPALTASIIDPLLQPLHPGTAVTVTDSKGNDLLPDVPQIIQACLQDVYDVDAEDQAKELLGQSLLHFDQTTTLAVDEVFAVQAGHMRKMPLPGPRVIYGAPDVIDGAKKLLAGTDDGGEMFASLAYAFHPHTLGFWFESTAAFEDFKAWLAPRIQQFAGILPGSTITLLKQLGQLTLKTLTEAIRIRKDDTDGNEEHSFARVVVNQLMTYLRSGTTSAGVLPFSVGETFCPQTIVLVNAEAHARATPATVIKEWKLIEQGIASPIKIVSHHQLAKLTSLPRAAARAAAQSARQQPGQPGSRSAKVVFRKLPPSPIDLSKDLTRVLRRMGKVNRSQNVFRTSRTSFLKANRRNPDDYNKPGRTTSVTYMPDIHIFLDTSGSISERNYQESVMMLIRLAKKLNVNIYVSSFSDMLSQETLLRTENRSVGQIWAAFRAIPKVTGGTEFKQVWDYINASPVRRRRLSLMITDFHWHPPTSRVEHPTNLFYAPCSAMDWDGILRWAQYFVRGMRHIDPSVAQKMLGLIR